jgi:IclR family pca regulon transcriptional regulator
VGAPIRGANGRTIAALNASAAAPRVSTDELRERFLPALLRTADQISASLARVTPPRVRV